MRTFTSTSAKFFCIIAALFISAQISASDINLRFTPANLDAASNELYVNIEVQYTQKGQLILAGQNYRFYYDSEVLDLNQEGSSSNLSSSYGDITFEDNLRGIEADHVNQLIFDDNLGFVNFSIDLSDVSNGGLALTEDMGWVSIATVKFDVKDADKRYDIVWGREGVSDLYATAFVEIAQWVSPSKLDIVSISNYGDLSSELEAAAVAVRDIAVGPNPTIDFVTISFDQALKNNTTLSFRDLTGKQVKSSYMNRGEITTTIDLSDLTASTYFLEIADQEQGLIKTTQVVIAK
jgi:hypothetical protein